MPRASRHCASLTLPSRPSVTQDLALAIALYDASRTLNCLPHVVMTAAAWAFARQWAPNADTIVESAAAGSRWSAVNMALPDDACLADVISALRAALRATPSEGRDSAPVRRLRVRLAGPDLPAQRVEAAGETKLETRDHYVKITAGPDGAIEVACGALDPDYQHDCSSHLVLGSFRTFLNNALAGPGLPLGSIALVTPEEQDELIQRGRGPHLVVDERPTHELIADAVRRAPESVAVTCNAGSLTFRDLWTLSGRVAAVLRDIPIRQNEPVGVLLSRSKLLLPALVGIWRAGAGYVPIDSDTHLRRTRLVLEDISAHGMTWVLTDDQECATELGLTVVHEHDIDGAPLALCRASGSSSRPNAIRLPQSDQLAYIMYTSGSTGRPKGTVVTHRNVTAVLQAVESVMALAEDEATVACTRLTFDISVLELFWPLTQGREVVLLDSIVDLDVATLNATLQTRSPVLMQLTPSTATIVDLPSEGDRLRILIGGEALPAATARRLLHHCGRLYNMYGPTEATVWATYHEVSLTDVDLDPVSIGSPLPNCGLLILDDHHRVVPVGMAGELYIYGPQLAAGYLDLDASSMSFLEDLHGISRLYKTGDRVRRLADGRLHFLGRLDNQVKIAGNRVELGEIEAALQEAPGVTQAVATVVEENDQPRITAFVQIRTSDTPTESEFFNAWLRVFDDEYAAPTISDNGFGVNLGLWRSSVDNKTLGQTEMQEWLMATAALLRATGATRILDVGCGNGGLLSAMGGDVMGYVGIEPSAVAVEQARQVTSELGFPTTFLRAAAADLATERLADLIRAAAVRGNGTFGAPDCIVFNSVVQYLPSFQHLRQVLHAAAGLLDAHGHLVLSDLCSLPLSRRFAAWLDSSRSALGVAVRRHQTDELHLDPRFLSTWLDERSDQWRSWVFPKVLRHRNEVSDFRFDVVLRRHAGDAGPTYDRVTYRSAGGTLDALAAAVREAAAAGRALCILGIPNARIVGATADVMALQPYELRMLTQLPGVRIGLDPFEAEHGSLLVAFHPEDRHDWSAIARDCPTPEAVSTNPLNAQLALRSGAVLWPWLRRNLPSHMIPAKIYLVDKMPLTHSGKLDRLAVAAMHGSALEAIQPSGELPAMTQAESLSFPPLGSHAVDIVISFLRTELFIDIMPDDNLVNAGLTSLQAARLAGILWDRLGWSVAPGKLLRLGTARSIGHASVTAGAKHALEAEPAVNAAELPMSLPQRAIVGMAYMEPRSVKLNIVMRWRLDGPLDIDRLQDAVRRVTRRHPILRSVVAPSGDRLILDAMPEPTTVVQEGPVEKLDRPFDIEREAPVRWRCRRITSDCTELIATLHHLCIDDDGIRTLHDALVAAYATEKATSEPGDVDRYRHAIAVERRLATLSSAEDRRYWAGHRGAFAGKSRNDLLSSSAASLRHTVVLPGGAETLVELARTHAVTTYSYFLASSAMATARELSLDVVVAAVPVSSRERVRGEGLLGCFANLFPLSIALHGRPEKEVVRDVYDGILGGLDHGLLPFAEIARHVQLPRHADGQFAMDLGCQLEPALNSATSAGVTFTPLVDPPFQPLYPLVVRGMTINGDLVVNVDYADTAYADEQAASIAFRIVSAIAGH